MGHFVRRLKLKMLKLARLKSLLSVTFNIFHMFQVGIYPQLNTCSDLTTDELIEDCSKCYLAGLPCADTVTTDTDQTFYSGRIHIRGELTSDLVLSFNGHNSNTSTWEQVMCVALT